MIGFERLVLYKHNFDSILVKNQVQRFSLIKSRYIVETSQLILTFHCLCCD